MELSYSINEIDEVAKKILDTHPDKRCLAFYAEMGSGKTTLIKALCKVLGVTDQVSSPTFSIINEYQIAQTQEKVFHMDWYRLKNEQDAIEAGVQDVLQQTDNYCFIEWPEIAPLLIPQNALTISIHFTSVNTRQLKFSIHSQQLKTHL